MARLSIEALQRKARSLRKAGRYEAAEKALDDAMRLAAATLADLHGTLGGVLREQGRYAEAVNEYDRGYGLDQHYGIASSYNALNRLVTRLMAGAGGAARTGPGKGARIRERVDVKAELRGVQRRLAARLRGQDAKDYWTAGDLAVVAALNGDRRAMRRGLALFRSPSTPPSAYDTYLETVGRLAGRQPSARHQLQVLHRTLAAGRERLTIRR